MVSQIVQADSYLTLHYRVTLLTDTGQSQVFVDTFVDKPATIQLGSGQWISAMERPLLGLTVGDECSFDLDGEYGEHNPHLVQAISRATLETHAVEDEPSFQVGEIMQFEAEDGASYSGLIIHVNDEWVTLDFNHPLAGKRLHVDVKILGVL